MWIKQLMVNQLFYYRAGIMKYRWSNYFSNVKLLPYVVNKKYCFRIEFYLILLKKTSQKWLSLKKQLFQQNQQKLLIFVMHSTYFIELVRCFYFEL